MSIKPSDIKRGDIWRVNFDPTIGTEIKKIRPAVVISSNSIGKLPIKLIAPITGWDPSFENSLWHTKINPDKKNNLTKVSAIDALQIRGVDIQRFISPKLGEVTQDQIAEIIAAIAAVIELQ
ncbi:MAG: type II toxin-antitoxin system PemK/MazF family toxin [Ignavibacteriaceae bacterium]|nr:type II toxin-antitoxin system PemK/MazF family toxin [Ignavibacteriaceae bacterium]